MKYNHDNPLRVVTLCSGYDSQCLALERLKKAFPPFDYELVAWAEFDPESSKPINEQPAVIAHNALFPQWADRNLGDMTKIDWNKVPGFDLLTYSCPCQSISSAGLQHGFAEGSGTRSSIIWYVREAFKVKRPKYALMENVSAMVSQKFLPMFNLWRDEVSKFGYESFAKVLNSRDFGVPQNRERIFLVSFLRDELNGRQFHFPEPFKMEHKLRDLLNDVTDTKYYLNPLSTDKFVRDNIDMITRYARQDDGTIEPLPENLKEWIAGFDGSANCGDKKAGDGEE